MEKGFILLPRKDLQNQTQLILLEGEAQESWLFTKRVVWSHSCYILYPYKSPSASISLLIYYVTFLHTPSQWVIKVVLVSLKIYNGLSNFLSSCSSSNFVHSIKKSTHLTLTCSDRQPQSQQNSYYPPSNNYDDYHHGPPPPHHGGGKHRPTCASSGDSYCLYDQEYPM